MNKTTMLLTRFKGSVLYRARLLKSILTKLDRDLPTFSIKSNKPREPVIGKVDSIFSVMTNIKISKTIKAQIRRLCRNGATNPLSIEADVAYFLYNLVRLKKYLTIVEVGIYRGAGSKSFGLALHSLKQGSLHLVDFTPEYLEEVVKKLTRISNGYKVVPHLGHSSSPTTLSKIPQADLIFLDADHTYDAIKKDFEAYWPKVKLGGCLLIHDTIMWEGARTFANELIEQGYPLVTLATSGGSGISLIEKTKAKYVND